MKKFATVMLAFLIALSAQAESCRSLNELTLLFNFRRDLAESHMNSILRLLEVPNQSVESTEGQVELAICLRVGSLSERAINFYGAAREFARCVNTGISYEQEKKIMSTITQTEDFCWLNSQKKSSFRNREYLQNQIEDMKNQMDEIENHLHSKKN